MRPSGPIPADIAIIGEAPGGEEERLGTPFVGPSGRLLDSLLRSAGLERDNCFVTNVCNVRPPGNDISLWISSNKSPPDPSWVHVRGKWVHPHIASGLETLEQQLAEVRPRLVIALGGTPLWALTGNTGILKWRGSRLSPPEREFTLLPTIHPAAILREPSLHPIVQMDLRRAKAIHEGTQLPRVYQFKIAPTFYETRDYLLSLLRRASEGPLLLSGDLETRGYHIACFGIADSADSAFCIPFLEQNLTNPFYWPLEEESLIVHLIVQLFLHPNITWVGQNFLYDCQYFHRFWGAVPLKVWDTMIGHHSIFSNMRKGLDFLSAMYAQDHVYWKDEIKNWDVQIGEKQFWTYNCLAVNTPVLMADCLYKPLGEIRPGDKVLAFEEEGSGERYSRRLREATVTKTARAIKAINRYTFSDGTFLDATEDHKVISVDGEHSRSKFTWKEFRELKIGDRVTSLGKPWVPDTTYEGGWLGGILDGEGTVGFNKSSGYGCYPRVAFSQKPGAVLEKALGILQKAGFWTREVNKRSAQYVDINGGLAEQLRILGTYRPIRLRANFCGYARLEGLSGFSGTARPKLVSIEPLGDKEVADITTTEGTFIAGGITVHNCKDACITWEIWHEIQSSQAERGVTENFLFQQSLFFPVLRMMNRGIRIDTQQKIALRAELHKAAAQRQDNLDFMAGHPLNPKSPKQLSDFFYKDLKLPGIRSMVGDSLTVNSPALATIAERQPVLRKLCQTIAELRSIGVFLSTFINAGLDSDGRMRCSFSIAGPTTFRFSSSENAFGSGMNLQNIPIAEKAKIKSPDYIHLPNIRKLFIPDPGYTFFDMDLDRADLQVVVWEADDADMKKALHLNLDMHCVNACDIFDIKGISYDELSEDHPNYKNHRARIGEANRAKAKMGVHATNYGVGDYKLATSLGITQREAGIFRSRWFGAHPGIQKWHRRTEESAVKRGWISNPFGVRFHVMGRFDLPECLAWQPQSTVARVINTALARIDAAEQAGKTSIQILLQVHDSLAGQFLTDRQAEEIETLRRLACVEIPYPDPLIIPVGINTSLHSWGHCK